MCILSARPPVYLMVPQHSTMKAHSPVYVLDVIMMVLFCGSIGMLKPSEGTSVEHVRFAIRI
jgi:hypothetical protein